MKKFIEDVGAIKFLHLYGVHHIIKKKNLKIQKI